MLEKETMANKDIDLIATGSVFWQGRLTVLVTTFVAVFAGLLILPSDKSSEIVSFSITPAGSSVFVKYLPLNSLINEINERNEVKSSSIGLNEMFGGLIIEEFFRRFDSVSSLKGSIGKSSFVPEEILMLSEEEREIALTAIAQAFEIEIVEKASVQSIKSGIKVNVQYQSEDVDFKRDIILEHAKSSVAAVKEAAIKEIETLIVAIEQLDKQHLGTLENHLENTIRYEELRRETKLTYLYEQLAIADELGIEKTYTTNNNQGWTGRGIWNTGDSYYLRGTIAIQKEIDMVAKRSTRDLALSNEFYRDSLREMDTIRSNTTIDELSLWVETLSNDDEMQWIKIDEDWQYQKQKVSKKRFLILYAVFGFIVGCAYVWIASNYRNKTEA